MLRERLLASTLGFVGLVAVSVVAQNPGDPANIANVADIANVAGNPKCEACERAPGSVREPYSVASPEWYKNGHFDPEKRTKKLSRQLKLTADQQSQMLDTLESTKSQLEAVWSDRSLSRKVRNRKLALIRQASNDQICAFLEKEQNAKLVRIRNSYAYHDSSPPNWFSR
jgi:hypothetical protein